MELLSIEEMGNQKRLIGGSPYKPPAYIQVNTVSLSIESICHKSALQIFFDVYFDNFD